MEIIIAEHRDDNGDYYVVTQTVSDTPPGEPLRAIPGTLEATGEKVIAIDDVSDACMSVGARLSLMGFSRWVRGHAAIVALRHGEPGTMVVSWKSDGEFTYPPEHEKHAVVTACDGEDLERFRRLREMTDPFGSPLVG